MKKNDGQIKLLIGIDDTDNANSRGTGYHARQLGHALEESVLGKVHGITRHQLYVHPNIRYTSQNSSACLNISTAFPEEVRGYCAEYLLDQSAPGSDAGLCIVKAEEVSDEIMTWGQNAKHKVLNMPNAISLASEEGIYLQGFTGNHEGIIGAMAAVGLQAGGNDGRYIWRKGIKELREMKAGILSARQLKEELDLDEIASLQGESPTDNERVLINEWVRPLLKNHKTILITQRTLNHDDYEWELTGKETIRSIS